MDMTILRVTFNEYVNSCDFTTSTQKTFLNSQKVIEWIIALQVVDDYRHFEDTPSAIYPT